jgi:hypothetical protein
MELLDLAAMAPVLTEALTPLASVVPTLTDISALVEETAFNLESTFLPELYTALDIGDTGTVESIIGTGFETGARTFISDLYINIDTITEAVAPEITSDITDAAAPEIADAAAPEITDAATSNIMSEITDAATSDIMSEITDVAAPEITDATTPEITNAAKWIAKFAKNFASLPENMFNATQGVVKEAAQVTQGAVETLAPKIEETLETLETFEPEIEETLETLAPEIDEAVPQQDLDEIYNAEPVSDPDVSASEDEGLAAPKQPVETQVADTSNWEQAWERISPAERDALGQQIELAKSELQELTPELQNMPQELRDSLIQYFESAAQAGEKNTLDQMLKLATSAASNGKGLEFAKVFGEPGETIFSVDRAAVVDVGPAGPPANPPANPLQEVVDDTGTGYQKFNGWVTKHQFLINFGLALGPMGLQLGLQYGLDQPEQAESQKELVQAQDYQAKFQSLTQGIMTALQAMNRP